MSEKYEIRGTVKLIQETQTFASGFTKRELVLTVEDSKYPQDINLEFLNDNVIVLDEIKAGDVVTIYFNIRGREYNGKYFNNLVGWKIAVDSAAAKTGQTPDTNEDIPF
jgi:hypothetical protein